MKTWTVKSKGRLEKIVIFYFFLLLILILVIFYAARRSLSELVSMNSDDVFFTILMCSPFWIPLIILTLKKLITSRVPKEITFTDNDTLMIRYSKRDHDFIPLENLAYSHSDLTKGNISLTFYKTFIGTRGQLVHNEVIQIIGMRWTRSWKIAQINEIVNYLTESGIQKKTSQNENMSLFDKISS